MNQEAGPSYYCVALREVLDELNCDSESIINAPRQFVLKEVPRAAELQELCNLPFEVEILSLNNTNLLLSTGTEDYSQGKIYRVSQQLRLHRAHQYFSTKVDFHTHSRSNEPVIGLYPSAIDFDGYLSSFSSKDESDVPDMLVATYENLVVVQKSREKLTDTEIKKLREKINRANELIDNVYSDGSNVGGQKEDKIAQLCIDLVESLKPHIITKFISWDEAQPVIDQYMNPANWSDAA